MVDVRVGQHDGIDRFRLQREDIPVAQPQLLEALEQSAVDQHALAAVLQQVFRSRDSACGTQESNSHIVPFDQ